jgi:mannosyltransferase OCH1-like enzyme
MKMLSHPVMIYDIFRLVYLYYNNGIYIDSKAGINDLQKINNLKKSTYFLKSKNGITNWLIYSKNDNPKILKYLIDNIVSDILKRKENISLKFEERVWETTGPRKIQKLLKKYNVNIIEEDKLDLIYDRRYSGSSWKEEGSYHNVSIKQSIYK